MHAEAWPPLPCMRLLGNRPEATLLAEPKIGIFVSSVAVVELELPVQQSLLERLK